MQHFLTLDKCTCGAYRYLAVREHKRSFEIYMIHHLHHSQSGRDSRKYAKLASIPKYRVDIHDKRINEELTQERKITLSLEQMTLLRSVLRQIESIPKESDEKGVHEQTDQIEISDSDLQATTEELLQE